MEKDIDKLSVLDAEAECLGDLLSAALREPGDGTEQCPLPEDIAALVDGRIVGEKRDIIMKHISSCDACCETFFLATELHLDEIVREDIPKKRSNIVIFKPLALAASILIVIISMYLFFKTDVPKTAEQLIEMEKPAVSRDIRQPPASTRMEAEFKDKEIKAEIPAAPIGYSMPKAKKGAPTAAEQDRLEEVEPAKVDRKPNFYKRKDDFKVAEKKASGVRTKKSVPREEELNEGGEGKKTRVRTSAALEKSGKSTHTTPRKMQVAAQVVERDTVVQKQEKRQVAPGRLASQDEKAGSRPSDALEKNMAWSQANLINQQSQVYKTHIPARELHNMFKDTIDLSNQLRAPFEKVRNEAQKTGDLKKIDTFVQGLAPLITIKSSKNVSYIYPNIGYFLSMSAPGSMEYKFFYLARAGWCEPASGCYDMEKEKLNRIIFGKTAAREKDDKSTSESQLSQWEALYPHLNGIFRKVARYTIENIKQQQLIPAERS